MSMHLNLATGQLLNSSNLIKIADSLILDRKSGKIVLSNLLVPRAGALPTLFDDATLDLNFAETKSIGDLVTFSRASSGTYVDSDGLIKSATTDAPRFDHDPVTGESLGLLIEEERTNYATQSANPSAWTPTNGSTKETFAAVTAPDGSTITQGFRLPDGGSRVYPTLSSPGTVEPVGSVYARAVSGTATLSLFIQGVAVQTNVTVPSDSWVRLNGTKASGGTTAFSVRGNAIQSEDVYLWGAQLEIASFPTSYIPTTGSTVTRAADLASIEGTNFSSWYNQSEGTVFVEAKNYPHPVTGKALVPFAFSDNTYNNLITLAGSTGSNQFNFDVISAGSLQRAILGNFVSSGLKASGGYKSTGSAGSLDGAAAVTSNTPNIPSVIGQLDIGRAHDGINILNGHIARLAYFPTRKTDQELIKITDGTLDPAIITYGITSAGGTFNLRSTGTVDYAVDWDSTGGYETSTSNTLAHTYTAGNYDLVVYSDSVYRPYFNNVTADASQITSVVIGPGANLGTDLTNAWYSASNMTSFVCPFDVTSGVTNLENTWNNCLRLASFPQINTSSVINFSRAWRVCQSLTSFPQIDTSSGINFSEAWRLCQSLTSFPQIDTSSGINFSLAWYNCNQITSFPLLDMSSATTFNAAWVYCAKLATFPAHMFDTTGALVPTAFNDAFSFCALTAQSIENILVSLDTNGATGITLSIDGGTNAAKTTWSAAAVTAYDNLIVKGWTISFNA